MNIVYTYSPLWLLLIFLISGGLSYWLYNRENILKEKSIWIARGLAILRFISLSFIAYFLLEPLIKKEEREIQAPIIAIAIDNSESIVLGRDSSFYKNDFMTSYQALAKELSEEYEVDILSFDNEVNNGFDGSFDGKKTNLSALTNDLETRYYNRNLGALIVASDGNYNQGNNPIYQSKVLTAPLYAVLLGDTTNTNDLAIDEVISNSISFYGDEFPVEINLSSQGLADANYSLEIIHLGRKIHEEKGRIDSDNWFKTFTPFISADKIGVQRYTVKVRCDKEEKIIQNNESIFYVDVIDERLKIAIISSAPHPDVALWKNSLQKNKNYEVEVFDADKFNKTIRDYSLFILYQVPNKINHTALLDQIKQANVPYLIQIGLSTNVNLLNQVFRESYTMEAEGDVDEEFKSVFSSSFSLFSVDSRIKDNQGIFPPLNAPLLKISSKQAYQKLMTKKIGQLDTDMPIWILSETSFPRSGIIIGEGLWRWRMTSYSISNDHELFDDFLQQTAKYLVRKSSNDRFSIDIEKEYLEGDRIKVNANLLNASMEPASNGDISMVLNNKNDEAFNYAFTQSANRYSLDIGSLNEGDYNYTVRANLGEEIFTKKGQFTIKKLMLEQKDSKANSALMHQWAKTNNGELFYPQELGKIKEKIKSRQLSALSYTSENFTDLIRIEYLFFLIVFLLSVEWFFRRYFGTY